MVVVISPSSFVSPYHYVSALPFDLSKPTKFKNKKKKMSISCCYAGSTSADPWSLSDGSNIDRPKPRSKNPKNPLSDDNARRIIKSRARYLSSLRRNQGSRAQTPRWIKRTPEQMSLYLEDDRNGHLYGRHVVAAIRRVRSLSGMSEGSYDMRQVMSSLVAKLTLRDMCTVLKEQRSWRQVRDFFHWMKLQLSYRPSVIVYTIVLRAYGQVGKIKLAEQTFLEMLEAGCEPDEVACGTMLCSYARWGRHKAMMSFFYAVQERRITLPVSVYNFMLSSLQKKSIHEAVVELWRHMTSAKVVPNQFTYTVVIGSLVKEGRDEDAFRTFQEMKKMRFVPEEATYSLLITLSSKNGNHDKALKLYEDMRQQRIVPSNFTCASLLSIHYKNGNYSKAVSLFSEMERYKIVVDEVIYGLLIRIYGKLGLYEDAQRTFGEIERLGILSDEKTYITMAQVHLNSGDCEKALSILEEMRAKNVLTSRFAFIVLLQCYVMKEDLVSAEATFHALSKTGYPDAGSCNDILNLYMRLGFTEKAKELVTQIRRNKVKFDQILLMTVLKVYCKERMVRDAEELIQELGTSGLFEDNKFVQTIYRVMHGESKKLTSEPLDQAGAMAFRALFALYIAGENLSKAEETLVLLLRTANGLSVANQLAIEFTKEGDLSEGDCLVRLLLRLGYKPEIASSAALINAYGKKHQLARAIEVFGLVADPLSADKHLYSSILDAFSRSKEVDKAYEFYKEQTDKGHDLGAVAISILVNVLANFGKYREAENVIKDSFHHNFELDTVAFNTFIKAMLDAGKLHFAVSIYEKMVLMGVAPSIQTLNTMISVHGRGRNLDKAVEMFNTARTMGLALDEKAYTNLICYYGKAGKSHEATFLFTQMQEEGLKPGQVSYNIMINIYAIAGLHEDAKELFHAMRRDGLSPDSFTYLSLVKAYSVGQRYSEAEETILLMHRDGISPSCAHFNLLLTALGKAGLIKDAERIYKVLLSSGLKPDITCYQTMIRLYMDHGHVKEGIAFFESINGSVKQDRFIMSAAVHLYESAGLDFHAEGILNSMNRLGIPFLKNLETGSKMKESRVPVLDKTEYD